MSKGPMERLKAWSERYQGMPHMPVTGDTPLANDIRLLIREVEELAAEPGLREREAKQFHENYHHMQDQMNNEIDKMRDRVLGAVAAAMTHCPARESGGVCCTLPAGHTGSHYVMERFL